MNRSLSLGLTMLAGVALGAAAITGLNAQTKPPAYVIINVSKITDPEGFKAVLNSSRASPAGVAPSVAATSSEPQRPPRSTEHRPSVSW
jgi:hypothetical protein